MTEELTYPGPFHTLDEIKRANKALGQTWFGKAEMRFFRTRIAPGVIAGRLFVTSETPSPRVPCKYSVRVASDDGSIDTLSEFQQFDTLGEARQWASMVPWYEGNGS